MNKALERLLAVLDLEEIEENIYRGQNEKSVLPRLYGGQVAAQALVAASRTLAADTPPHSLHAHSLHAYFLRPGDPKLPVVFTVDRIRDGRSFSTRNVVAVQKGKAIFSLSASFQTPEEGFEHARPMPEVPPPEELPTTAERIETSGAKIPEELRSWITRERPIEMRSVGGMMMLGDPTNAEGPTDLWLRASGDIGNDDPALHQHLLVYASDMSLIDTMARRHVMGMQRSGLQMASLDHALWMHRPVCWDDWILYHQESPAAGGGRGFSLGHFFDRKGTLLASVAQEGLMRQIKK